jgi:hypothetical protein
MSASFGEVCWFRGGLVFVAEICLFPSLRMVLRFSLRAPFIELFEIIGLGSSLGVGDGRTGAAVLNHLSAVPLRYLQLPWVSPLCHCDRR